MKNLLISCLLIFPLLGCGSRRAEPLALEEISAAFASAFKGSREETRSLTQAIGRLVERKQYAPASMQLQGLLSDPSLTKEQRSVVARALTSINESLQKQVEIQEAAVAATPSAAIKKESSPKLPDPQASESSTAEAAAVLEIYKRSK